MLNVRRYLALPLVLALASLLPALGGVAADREDIPASGPTDKRLASFDRMMTRFLKAHPRVPGATLAVARDGKLVYSRGFGFADSERKHPVQPDSRFRIASISKLLTAVAILQLVERGQLKLNDKVFDVLGLKAPDEKGVSFDKRWHRVTIQHLLHHTGGWDRDKSFDPMFHNGAIRAELKIASPARQEQIIRYMLRHPLDFDPGQRYAYSNFGYCLLGRVIEKVSGKRYEEYVRRAVLAPVGASDTQQGKTLPKGRLPGEVWYDAGERKGRAILGPNLGKRVPLPYGCWCLEAMDSHGGWVSTAADLVHFAAAFDHPARSKLLKAASIETMFAPPPGEAGHDKGGKVKEVYYGCGWEVRIVGKNQRNTWHTGSLDGTSTLLVRRCAGLTWAVLFNSRDGGKESEPAVLIDPLVHEAADAVKEWP